MNDLLKVAGIVEIPGESCICTSRDSGLNYKGLRNVA